MASTERLGNQDFHDYQREIYGGKLELSLVDPIDISVPKNKCIFMLFSSLLSIYFMLFPLEM